ncbi:MAG: hypothetical protein V1837_00830 [Candidatus Woesearchaeota archaeon]
METYARNAKPLGRSSPVSLDVGYHVMNPGKKDIIKGVGLDSSVEFVTFEKFDLK